MKFTKRIFTAVLLTICLLFNCVAYAGSAAVMDPDEKLRMIEGLLEERWRAASQGDTDTVDKLNQQLQSLQVEELTTADMVSKLYGDADAVPMFDLPTSNNVAWTSTRLTYRANGVLYEVQYVYVEPRPYMNTDLRNAGSALENIEYTVRYDVASVALNLIWITAGVLAPEGSVAANVITAFDYLAALVSGSQDSITLEAGKCFTYSFVNATFLKLAFVKRADEPDSAQMLQFMTSRTQTRVQVGFMLEYTDSDGHFTSQGVSHDYYIENEAPYYRLPIYDIVEDYVQEEPLWTSYVTGIPIYCGWEGNRTRLVHISPFTPSGLAQIIIQ